MEIPYMKIFIYCLTFLGYAWTGMGSGMLSNLRDAVLAAETVFGDVMKNVITLAEKFRSVHDVFDAAVDENCVYKCPEGGPPGKNRNHVPSSNGCGSLGIQINSEYLPIGEMTICCDNHDKCYDTCNSGKEKCDLDFQRCLYNYCETYKPSIGGDAFIKGCKGASKILYTGTLTLGCKSYLDSQSKACYCSVKKSKYKKFTKGGGEL